MVAVARPASKEVRSYLVDKGQSDIDDPKTQRETLSRFAIVFIEDYPGQFTAKPSDPNVPQKVQYLEYQYVEGKKTDKPAQVLNLGIVEVGDDGSIIGIVKVREDLPGGKDKLKEIMETKGGWKVRLKERVE